MNLVEKIIIHFLQKNASPEELTALDQWSDQEANRNQLKDYFRLWIWSSQLKTRRPEVEFDDTWREILHRRNRINPGARRLIQFVRYAAVVLILLNLGWWGARLYYSRSNGSGEQAFLIAADQKANSVITLPDQTQVYLREGSTLSYTSGFRSDSREVLLKGEAYFEVTRDEEHPFVVKMEHASVEVLGTRFNVLAEKGSSVYQTTLVNGKVIFQSEDGKKYQLLPEQMIEFDVNSQQVRIGHVNTELYTAWKDGKVIFRDATLGEITDQLERIYHVEFVYKRPDLAQKYRFSGTFHRETSIGEVITMLKLSIPMEVTREERFPDPDRIYLQ
jgi:ferric-dicitrate binding protein FerR (iron transport regulator)